MGWRRTTLTVGLRLQRWGLGLNRPAAAEVRTALEPADRFEEGLPRRKAFDSGRLVRLVLISLQSPVATRTSRQPQAAETWIFPPIMMSRLTRMSLRPAALTSHQAWMDLLPAL